MVRIKWLPEALDDIQRLYDFLITKDINAAERATASILEGGNLLKTSPRIGKPMADESYRRELFIAFGAGAYVLRYKLEHEHTVVIIRVWHSRENKS